jgi:ABC-type antimicrobial peptide transport system permease subunit
VFSLTYIGRELRRRLGRTLLTALGLAVGVGMVIGIISVSQGLDDAQKQVLAPLSSVGTDIVVTRINGTPASSSASTTTTAPDATGGGFRGGGGGGGFFAGGGGGGRNNALNSSDTTALLNDNSNVVTDLSKLGKPGTKFTHDFFLSVSLISFPQEAVGQVSQLAGVTSAVPGLTQQVQHQTGTVPEIVSSIKTGGQTYTQTQRPAPLTDAERQAFQQCLADKGVTIQRRGNGGGGGAGGTGGGGTGGGGGFRGGGGGGGFLFGGGNPAFDDCLPARYKEFNASFTVPLQTIRQTVNPPSTNISNDSYQAAGVDPNNQHAGLITSDQLTSGKWFSKNATTEVLVNDAYMQKQKLKLGAKLPINGTDYTIVGTVKPTLTGETADVYFPLASLQKLAGKQDRVTQIFVTAKNSNDVDKVAAEIKQALPGAEVLTSKQLADQASGSLSDAHKLADNLGGALAFIVLIAAFIIAALLTLSSIGKRVREIGTLRAIGWSKGRVVRQLLGETMGIALIGAVFGLLIGGAVVWAINQSATTLKSTSIGVNGTASGSAAQILGVAQQSAVTTTTTLHASLSGTTLLLGIVFALIGGLIAGLIGSWRAARLAPATALRDIG